MSVWPCFRTHIILVTGSFGNQFQRNDSDISNIILMLDPHKSLPFKVHSKYSTPPDINLPGLIGRLRSGEVRMRSRRALTLPSIYVLARNAVCKGADGHSSRMTTRPRDDPESINAVLNIAPRA